MKKPTKDSWRKAYKAWLDDPGYEKEREFLEAGGNSPEVYRAVDFRAGYLAVLALCLI